MGHGKSKRELGKLKRKLRELNGNYRNRLEMLGALLWEKWGLFEPQGIQALKSSAVWRNSVARGVS